ncbi:Thioredoxin reductase 1 [Platanthera guangdongensis]|uniref:Thioredoxin reductase 1 n=1 Tax=Platanthera guangdongensis TaxID=2320717 RepID=A0ABR2LFV6_9ASPA
MYQRDMFRVSKIMQVRDLSNPKIDVLWNSQVLEACGENEGGSLGGVQLKNLVTEEIKKRALSGLFFAIGHDPATKFLGGGWS